MPNLNKPFDETRIPQVTTEEAARRHNHWVDGLIIDSAREPLLTFEKKQPERSAQRSYLWYHLLRPCVLVAFWLFVLWYVWTNFFDIGGALVKNDALLLLYAVIIGVIFLAMLVLAPVRRHYQKRAMGAAPLASSTAEPALYAAQRENTQLSWQGAQTVNAYHDASGELLRMDVLVEHDSPHHRRLARLLGLLKVPRPGPALSGEEGSTTDMIVTKPGDEG